MSEWYVIKTSYADDKNVKAFLEANGFEVKMFWREAYYRRQGKIITIQKLFFPNYIFVVSDLDFDAFDREIALLKLKYSKPFYNLKYRGDEVPALTEEEKAFLYHLCGEDQLVQTSIGYIEGDKVFVTDGPLQGLESEIVYINRHKRIAKLSADFLGSTREIIVPLEIIYKR